MKTTLSQRQLNRFRRDGRIDVGGGWSLELNSVSQLLMKKGIEIAPMVDLRHPKFAMETFSNWMEAFAGIAEGEKVLGESNEY